MNREIDFLNTETYYYNLPQELIAQDPAEPRDSSRLLLINKSEKKYKDTVFHNIVDYLRPGDLLVMNDTRVFPARLIGHKKSFEGAKVELFLIRPEKTNPHMWTALVKPGKKVKPGTPVILLDGTSVTVGDILEDGLRYVEFSQDCIPFDKIHELGEMPLPHYINNTHASPERYQTVYSKNSKERSVAAPTAGLHFTDSLLKEIEEKGVETTFVTLEVGLGTFRPVKTANIKDHIMHTEFCDLNKATVKSIIETKHRGGRVIAVGTTVVRTLESFAKDFGTLAPGHMSTNLFIYPGYDFKVIDALITNFHLPESTLLMLVSAFGGYDVIMNAYQHAIEERYRFFSFGDSMFIY